MLCVVLLATRFRRSTSGAHGWIHCLRRGSAVRTGHSRVTVTAKRRLVGAYSPPHLVPGSRRAGSRMACSRGRPASGGPEGRLRGSSRERQAGSAHAFRLAATHRDGDCGRHPRPCVLGVGRARGWRRGCRDGRIGGARRTRMVYVPVPRDSFAAFRRASAIRRPGSVRDPFRVDLSSIGDATP